MALLLVFAATGCGLDVDVENDPPSTFDGDRARRGCPAQATCSDATPDGLRLRSNSLDSSPFITAEGGTQSLPVEYPDGRSFDRPFTADADTTEIEVIDVAGGQLVVRGAGVGGTFVNLRDADTGHLYERFFLQSKPVAKLLVRPLVSRGLFNWPATAVFTGVEIDVEALLLSPDSESGLFGNTDELLADEGMEIGLQPDGDPVLALRPGGWNHATVTAGEELGETSIVVRLSSGVEHSFYLAVVNRVAQLETSTPSSVAINETFAVCATALHEDGGLVLGTPLTFEVSGPARLDVVEGACADMIVTGAAQVELTVRAPGGSATVVLPTPDS